MISLLEDCVADEKRKAKIFIGLCLFFFALNSLLIFLQTIFLWRNNKQVYIVWSLVVRQKEKSDMILKNTTNITN